ncbi:MAG: DUF664 domain-containing protein [Chloroflexi bacterium]|nr:DUF664 domain-containing protein [Chloroflexota bacterium]
MTHAAADPEPSLYLQKIASSIDRVLACLDGLTPDELAWRPLPNASNLASLAAHVLGNTRENVLSVIGGMPNHRDRDAEFVPGGSSTAQLRQRWQALQLEIERVLGSLSGPEMASLRAHPRRGAVTVREICLVVARHVAEHAGQAELTRDLLLAQMA